MGGWCGVVCVCARVCVCGGGHGAAWPLAPARTCARTGARARRTQTPAPVAHLAGEGASLACPAVLRSHLTGTRAWGTGGSERRMPSGSSGNASPASHRCRRLLYRGWLHKARTLLAQHSPAHLERPLQALLDSRQVHKGGRHHYVHLRGDVGCGWGGERRADGVAIRAVASSLVAAYAAARTAASAATRVNRCASLF